MKIDNDQQKIIRDFPIIYEKISKTYHNDRFSGKWGTYDYYETNLLISELLKDIKKSVNGSDILDVGCGTGKVSIPLALMGANVFCLDASEGMLIECYERAREQGCEKNVTPIKASAENIPDCNDKYDIVISTRFLHLFPLQMYPIFIGEMLRVVKPDGYVIIEIKNRFYGGFINLRNEFFKKFSGGTPSSSMTRVQINKLIRKFGQVVYIKGCSLPKGQNVPRNSNFAIILRALSRRVLRGITFSSYVVIRKIDED